ncbi:hypothetical protein MYU51_016263 [Penicillium brevicompactum]|uniref:uncharacterized protein n=1 Tax=Penicillium brevicompactum TaxID=5074 RepID=UPI0025411280|nr:uncharacterized protein N7506_002895 [Penicillium brevicompactum]KAJ5343071.1 hypothetical protein N7506_002895 [Penicillium brevicompactum]
MGIPSTFEEVKTHLAQVLDSPSTALNIPLIETLKLQLSDSTDPVVPITLLSQIPALLAVLQEDPTPITTLAIQATASFTFTDLQSIEPPINLLAGLQAPSPPVNLLALSLLSKAAQTSSEAAIVAGDSTLVAALVETSLLNASGEVADAASNTLWELLKVDAATNLENEDNGHALEGSHVGQGLLWRRVFTDKDVYGSFFRICSLQTDSALSLSKYQRTQAQARLFVLLVRAAKIRWDIISTSQIPDIETKYRSTSLLHFATNEMVEEKDGLMQNLLLQFYRDLLEIDAPGLVARSHVQSTSTFASPALEFLIEHKVHSKVLTDYLDGSRLDPVDLIYMSRSIVAYVARYAELYPNHLLRSPNSLVDGIISRINRSLAIPALQYSSREGVPSDDLAILASLPRPLLVEAGKHGANPLLAIPTNPANAQVLDVLARIFHGPERTNLSQSMDLNTSGQTPTDWDHEAAAARILYFQYLNQHPNFWDDVVSASEVLVMPDVALSAHTLMRAIATANWQPLTSASPHPHASRFQLPSEEELSRVSPANIGLLPSSGAWSILTPPALTTLLPYLFKPPKTYADFVGGGASDAHGVVWKVATAKHDVLVSLLNRLQESDGRPDGFDDIVGALQKRVNEGPWGPVQSSGTQVLTAGL